MWVCVANPKTRFYIILENSMLQNMQGKIVDRLDQFTSNDVPYIAPFNVV